MPTFQYEITLKYWRIITLKVSEIQSVFESIILESENPSYVYIYIHHLKGF
jgi:hypothetical protein